MRVGYAYHEEKRVLARAFDEVYSLISQPVGGVGFFISDNLVWKFLCHAVSILDDLLPVTSIEHVLTILKAHRSRWLHPPGPWFSVQMPFAGIAGIIAVPLEDAGEGYLVAA